MIWHPATHIWRNRQNQALRPWLIAPGSLTKAIENHTQKSVTIKVLKQYFGIPTPSEQHYLGIKKSFALIREVYLCIDNKPWIYARTIIPCQCLTGKFRRLKRWGKIAIGHFLFGNNGIKRGPIEIAYLSSENVWARRSIFSKKNKKLLITEVFLPAKWDKFS